MPIAQVFPRSSAAWSIRTVMKERLNRPKSSSAMPLKRDVPRMATAERIRAYERPIRAVRISICTRQADECVRMRRRKQLLAGEPSLLTVPSHPTSTLVCAKPKNSLSRLRQLEPYAAPVLDTAASRVYGRADAEIQLQETDAETAPGYRRLTDAEKDDEDEEGVEHGEDRG